jgi:hypothetical protein
VVCRGCRPRGLAGRERAAFTTGCPDRDPFKVFPSVLSLSNARRQPSRGARRSLRATTFAWRRAVGRLHGVVGQRPQFHQIADSRPLAPSFTYAACLNFTVDRGRVLGSGLGPGLGPAIAPSETMTASPMLYRRTNRRLQPKSNDWTDRHPLQLDLALPLFFPSRVCSTPGFSRRRRATFGSSTMLGSKARRLSAASRRWTAC